MSEERVEMAVREDENKAEEVQKVKTDKLVKSDAIDQEPENEVVENGEEGNSNSSSNSSGSSDGAVPSTSELSADRLNDIQIARNSTNRVKLYVLCDQRIWDDRGTGHVACVQYPDDPATWCIVVRLEATEKNVLESPVHRDTVYQRQQGTLIVWSESESCDLALSFQEKNGCTAIWDRICQIQGKDPDADEEADIDDQQSDSSNSNGSLSAGPSISIPTCTLANLQDIETLLSGHMSSPSSRERMASSLQSQGYIPKLCDLFKICEDMESEKHLHSFYNIAKNMFLLNSNMILNELLDEKYFYSVVGMLEYDPTNGPKKHREFLYEKSKFREVLPIKTEELKKKIQMTYRAQYVQDVCLPAPSLFEENLLTCLSSHLFFSRAEIVSALLNDKELMRQLFDELKDPKTPQIRRRDLTKFLKEFCSFVHSLQASGGGREQFFKTILNQEMLAGIDLCISSPYPSTRVACIDVISMIIDYNPIFMRDFLFKQAKSIPEDKPDDVLLNKIVKLIMLDKDPELTTANNISLLIRNLLDAESIVTLAAVARTSPRSLLDKQSSGKGEKTDFFFMFYQRVIDTLVQPLFVNIKDGNIIRDDYYRANQMALILELLSFCVENHMQSMRNFVIAKDLLSTVAVFLKSKHQFMALCALRVIRKVVQHEDEAYIKYIVEKKVVDPIVEALLTNGNRYNLMNSAILEFFDFILARHQSVVPLLKYTVENHFETLKEIEYVQLFKQMKIRHDALENCKVDIGSSMSSEESPVRRLPTQWSKERDYDNDELFFSKDDEDEEEEEEETDFTRRSPQRKSGMEPMYPSVAKRKLNSDEEGVASIFGGSLSPSISSSSRKILIKVASDRLDTPSPPPENDEENGSTVNVAPVQFGSNSAPVSPLVTSSVSATEPERKRPRFNSSPATNSAHNTTPRPASAGMRRAMFNMNRSVSTTRSPNSSPQRAGNGELEFDKPIIVKSLVDYDESDDDEDDENEEVEKKENGKGKPQKQEKVVTEPSSSTESPEKPKENGLNHRNHSPDSTSDLPENDIQSNQITASTDAVDQSGDFQAKILKEGERLPQQQQHEAEIQTTSV
ncbi:unnamed protein product [Bursaphelenchus xylophilus]|uniref:(pine wood nematode) hypothetical protein n=1 Tax=Bursaphelenchus xylophilus TaxID=6326 RepID=A0A1I7S9X1_BURXY|nr:unnamed protein product [Bursaphelenchus xylophilus]CAG9126227.1 unnamed protein product [Bursaphelenchus xylophilus]